MWFILETQHNTAIPGHFFLGQAPCAELKPCSEIPPFNLNIGELDHSKNIWGWMFCILSWHGQLGAATRGDRTEAQKKSLFHSKILGIEGIACHAGPCGKASEWSGGKQWEGKVYTRTYIEVLGGLWGIECGPKLPGPDRIKKEEYCLLG